MARRAPTAKFRAGLGAQVSKEQIQTVLEIVTYDPVRRSGWLKADAGGRAMFHLGKLPKAIRRRVAEASRALNRAKKKRAPPEEWRALTRSIRQSVVGVRMQGIIKVQGTKIRPVWRTLQSVEDSQ